MLVAVFAFEALRVVFDSRIAPLFSVVDFFSTPEAAISTSVAGHLRVLKNDAWNKRGLG